MRKLKLFFACLLMAVLSIGQVWGATYFEDTFSNVGNSDNQSISSRTGWGSFSKCYSQGNSGLRIGSSSAAGSVTKTAMTNISGTKDLKVTVYTARYNTNANNFTVSVANGTISEVTGVGTLSAGKITISPSNNAGVTTTTSAATWTDAYKTVFTITGASSSTTITFASNKRVILGPIKIEDAVSTTPTLSVSPEIINFGTVEQGTSVANKTVAVNFANLTGSVSYSGLTSPFTASGSISNTGDNITIAANTSTIGEYSRTLTVQSTADSKSATVTVKMNVVAPFNGEVLEIKNTDFATSYASANGDHEFGCITITSNQVGNYSSSIQVQNSAGYLYNKTSLGEIAKIEITKTGNNKLVVYEGTSENPSETSITGVANGNVTTYTFSNGKSYFRISSDGTGASNVTPIKVYYHPASYEVTLSAGSNGSLSATVDAAAIESGDDVEMCKTVTIAATPNEGYKIKSLTVTDEDDDEVEVTSNQFVMPAKAVTVAATFEATKALSSITLSGTHRTSFWQGETFSSEGLVVTAHYDDESSATVTPASITGYNMSTAGNQTVTVSYTEGTEKTATYDITVKAVPNTAGSPYTVVEAKDLIDKLGTTANVFVAGKICQIDSYNEGYHSITYWISDDGTTADKFEVYGGLDFADAEFGSIEDLAVGQDVIVNGEITYYAKNSIYEFSANSHIVSRPKVLVSIALSDDDNDPDATAYQTEFTQGDAFSHEHMVVTAHYNSTHFAAADVTELDDCTWSGYNMSATGNQTVTVSYTEGGVTKTATYGISVAAPDLCEHKATISKGAEVNGTFSLSVSGEQCLDELEGYKTSTVLTATPAEHYHLSEVTATVGTVGVISENSCTISNITANTTITAVFAEDDKVTIKFDKGTESATGVVPNDVADKYAGQSVTLPANPFTYTGSPIKVFGGWKHSLTNEVKQPGSYTITAADAAEDNITFTAVWNDLSPWATVYTSNVELKGNSGTKAYAEKVKITVEEVLTEFDALRACTGSAAGSCTVKVPAGTQTLHFHAAAWNAKTSTITVTMGETELLVQALAADAGIKNSSPYTLEGIPYEYYYSIDLSSYSLTEETTITFSAGSDKRFVLFGVNAVYPAAITLDPASKDFGEVKENANAQFEFTITPNAMSAGDLVASIIGTNAAKFSVGAISENKVTVTFAPGEVGGPYSASLKIVSDNAEVTAALSGTGITSATPEIGIDKTEVAFGNVEQNTIPATQSVAVTLSNIDEDGVSAAITGSVFSLSTNKLTAAGSIVITPVTTTPGTYSETLTLSATGATSKNVTVTMTVVDEWAYVYTSNVELKGNSDTKAYAEKVKITVNEVLTEFDALRACTGSAAGSCTIKVPAGTQTLHFHAAAWNAKTSTITVTMGETELLEQVLAADAGIKNSSPYTLEGIPYEYYYSIDLSSYSLTEETTITFSAGSDKRFVLFGVNQEGGVLPELQSIAISGDLDNKSYKAGQALDMTGLTVEATYTLGGTPQTPVDITNDPGLTWTYDPLVENQDEVTVTAHFGDPEKTASKTIEGLTVTTADPKIYVSTLNVNFASVEVGESVPAAETVTVTLTNVASVTATLGGTNADAFSVSPASLTESGDITISILANTDAAASYAATLTISDGEGGADDKTVNLSFEVTEPVTPEDPEVRKTWDLSIASYDANPTENQVKWSATYVNMVVDKYNATTNANNYLGGDANNRTSSRFYQNSKLTITPNGKEITSVVFTATSTGYANALQGSEWTNASASVDGTTVTVTPTDGKNAIIAVVGGTCGFTAVQVNYKNIAPEPPTADYTRDGLTVGNYATICLPNGGTISGATLFDLDYYDGANTLYLLEVNGNAMVAGRPYVFLPSGTSIEVFYTDDANEPAGSYRGLVGSYSEHPITADDGNYILYQNAYYLVNSQARVGANRAYIHMDAVPTAPQMQQGAPRRRVAMSVHGTNTATGIDALNASDAPVKVLINGQLFIIRGEKMFDVKGQLVK